MRPLKLTVSAFGPYGGEQVIDFGALDGRSFFLIHGPTGAGKTSVLDAICFALFGRASGDNPRLFRSDHARPEVRTEVTFDFSIGERRYRVRRAPDQERPKKRGAGTTTEVASATVWERSARGDAEEWRVLDDGATKATERVEQLLGFRVDQFRQVVMLPQGMFQRLLLSKSDDRQKILEALFTVEAYGTIERALKEEALGVKRGREQSSALLGETLRAAGAENKEQLAAGRAEAEGRRVAALVEVEALKIGRKATADALAAARAVADKLSERDAAAAEVRRLEGRREEIALKQGRHERACKAAGLVQQEEELRRRKGELDRAVEKLEAAAKRLEAATVAEHAAAKALEVENGRAGEREAAAARAVRLDQLVEKVGELAAAATAAEAARKTVAAARAARADAEKSAAAAQAAVEGAEARRAVLEAVFAGRDTIEARHNRAGMELNTRKALDAQRQARDEAAARVARLRADLARSEQNLTWAKETLADLQDRWNRGQAALLARSLAAGEPCPVCGSREHPGPAHAADELPSEDKLKAAGGQAERLGKEHAAALADVAKAEAEVRGIEAQIAQLRDGLGLRIGGTVESLEREVKELELKRREAEDAGLELGRVKLAVDAAKSQQATAAKSLAAADEALGTHAAALSAAEAVLAERRAAVPEELRAAGALEREREAARRRRKGLEDALAATRAGAEHAARELAARRADLAGAKDHEETSRALFGLLQKEFGERARAAGFEDHKSFKAARLTDDETAALDAEIRDYHVAVGAAADRLKRAATAAGELATPDLAGLAAADSAAQRAVDAKVGEAAQLAQRVAAADESLRRLAELEARLAALDERYKVIGSIADAANGNNDYNMTFQRYVLGVFLDEVLYAATQRLRTMSKGRYLLQRVTETASGNRAGGLDLQVHDTHTSTVRPVSTLSGGESFLASLSLALGLADVVQSYAGGIRLETIFVDEGFGTLDPESLDLAIRALRDLQKGGRLVGIISHVTELKEWIDARLEVVPGRGGSVARFVVA